MSDKNSAPKEEVAEVGSQPEAHEEGSVLARDANEARLTAMDNRLTGIDNRLTSMQTDIRGELTDMRGQMDRRFADVQDQLNNMPSKLQKELASNNMTVNVGGSTATTENTNTNTNSNTNKVYKWEVMSITVSFCLVSLMGCAKLLGWI